MSSDVDFAILAPVPIEHIQSALSVLESQPYVAFGSRKWELFREVERLRQDRPVPVLVYPSAEDVANPASYLIAWTALYVGSVETPSGRHPDGMAFRPPSTEKYAGDNEGYWAVFWHVTDLRRLGSDAQRPISSLLSHKSGQYWKPGFAPRGPEIVARPNWI